MMALVAVGCSSQPARNLSDDTTFKVAQPHEAAAFIKGKSLAEFEGSQPNIYTMGPGDEITGDRMGTRGSVGQAYHRSRR